ncbi:hypothetical protein DM01DRAFT_1337078 [Hesseltinella vesiculosa]|uniref:Uncharacterized protein n=1 Tax=Hesseltinella vesiculosa TaxID=101127 RepID=A0A1X2GDU9_9FUNG|nr:hypothetical protein DM01DRAFT_1337078 [Hesseltinella vesiculosa]
MQGPLYLDQTENGQELVVYQGGPDGYGNPHFLATSEREGHVRCLELRHWPCEPAKRREIDTCLVSFPTPTNKPPIT